MVFRALGRDREHVRVLLDALRKSRLRMAYIGAESPSEWLLHEVRKGTHLDQTLEAVEVCRGHGVTPELSFMLAPPQDPEGETEKTFEFIRLIKRRYPDVEIMIYIYTPLPAPAGATSHSATVRSTSDLLDAFGRPVVYPDSADGWAQPQWLAYWCHKNAPWLSERLRRRISDFETVLGCRFPTVIDVRSAAWGKSALPPWLRGVFAIAGMIVPGSLISPRSLCASGTRAP